MAPGFSDKWKNKLKKALCCSDSDDESKQPSTAQLTTPAHTTSFSAATPTTSTTTTAAIRQSEAASTAQPIASSTGQPPASPPAPTARPQSTQSTASSTPRHIFNDPAGGPFSSSADIIYCGLTTSLFNSSIYKLSIDPTAGTSTFNNSVASTTTGILFINPVHNLAPTANDRYD
ncbi:hypothetical protein CEP52_001017 [Fusarium oligoseptatum]|uniref:Uncharacterized protein n=2 Tax=Fusarium solani species complex TaxID=232080 RepID=A0A428UKZ6_9HYPO|nr:hypothetical protein CEP51_010749 [Fusarium floridanum]RSM14977.1 hypothetical protein CEP52_001017 [Fusarium oligoseptatum]